MLILNRADKREFVSDMREIVRDMREIRIAGLEARGVSVSAGAAWGTGERAEELAARADKFMYRAKRKKDLLVSEDARFSDIGHIYCFTNTEYIFAALKNGYADAIAGHEVALRERMKNSTGAYRILDETLLSVDLGVAFKKDKDEELAALVGTALRVMKNDGFTAKVLKKYGLDPDKLLAVSV